MAQNGGILAGSIIATDSQRHKHRVKFYESKIPPTFIDDCDLMVSCPNFFTFLSSAEFIASVVVAAGPTNSVGNRGYHS